MGDVEQKESQSLCNFPSVISMKDNGILNCLGRTDHITSYTQVPLLVGNGTQKCVEYVD